MFPFCKQVFNDLLVSGECHFFFDIFNAMPGPKSLAPCLFHVHVKTIVLLSMCCNWVSLAASMNFALKFETCDAV